VQLHFGHFLAGLELKVFDDKVPRLGRRIVGGASGQTSANKGQHEYGAMRLHEASGLGNQSAIKRYPCTSKSRK
jgi:hypothetical protein